MTPDDLPEIIHYSTGSPNEPYACGLVIKAGDTTVPHTSQPELVKGCVVCMAAAHLRMSQSEPDVMAIFAICGCEVKGYLERPPDGIIVAPYPCFEHGGYFLGEGPGQVAVIYASAEEVRTIVRESLEEWNRLR